MASGTLPPQPFYRTLLLTSSGPIVWALHFIAIYGFHGLVCARPEWDWQWWGMSAAMLGVLAAGVVALVAIAVFCAWAWPRKTAGEPTGFLAWTTVGLGALSALAVVYETITVWLVPVCG
ncbi:hypothetical protein WG922_04570 [Ramlibacter sp. AN1015]|uniref:hypothetical protein n=1 Tax=Ramlibacter sp. AN1015 TaxID=3133428 RepID=UPI0030BFA5F7